MLFELIARKFFRLVVTLLLLVTAVFFALRLTGDPAIIVLGPDTTEAALVAFRTRWGLDRPLIYQYSIYLSSIFLHLDFGHSILDGRSVSTVILDVLPATLSLMIPSAFVTLAFGISTGIYAALHKGKIHDTLTMFFSVISFSLPNFILGIFLMMIFAAELQWLPSSGNATVWHYILPIITMATADAAIFSRFMRSAMLEVIHQPYILAAKARGLSQRQTLFNYALPNALLAVLTVAGFFFGTLIGGAVITENVFAWPGIGRLLIQSVALRDVNVVQGIVILIGFTMVFANFAVDLIIIFIDPRLRTNKGY